MRELKFRAWKIRPDGKAEHWTCPPFGYEKNADDVAFTVGAGHTMNIKEFIRDADIIEQYTGLKDKNGKEIYEGDIIKQTWFNGDDGDITVTGVVGFDEDEASFDIVQTISTTNRQYSGFYSQREVIGNIHENANLLEEEK